MSAFTGFSDRKTRLTPLPDEFFTGLLPLIDDLGELKLSLYCFWAINQMEGSLRCLLEDDLRADTALLAALGGAAAFNSALEKALARGTLLAAPSQAGQVLFLNTPRGRAGLKALQAGAWDPSSGTPAPPLRPERPNIYALYEANIGPLTPLIAEALEDAEKTYPLQVIADAFRAAVENNARSWRYVDAVLKAWQERGRDETDQRNAKKGRRKYTQGEFGDLIQR